MIVGFDSLDLSQSRVDILRGLYRLDRRHPGPAQHPGHRHHRLRGRGTSRTLDDHLIEVVILIGVVMRYNADAIIDTILKGASGLVSTAFVVPLAAGIKSSWTTGRSPRPSSTCARTPWPPCPLRLRRRRPGLLLPHRLPDSRSSTGLAAATMGITGAVHLRRRRRPHHGHHLPPWHSAWQR